VICVGIRPDRRTARGLFDKVGDVCPFLAETEFAWVNVRVENVETEVPSIAEKLGFSAALIPPVLERRPSALEDRDAELALRIPAIRVKEFDVSVHPLLVLMRKGLIVTISDRAVVRLARFSRYAEPFFRKLPHNGPWGDTLTLVLVRILDENNERNYDGLRTIEEEADKVGECLADPATSRMKIGEDIYHMKHALITYLNMLWATLDVINTLRYGDADVISDDEKILSKIELLASDLTRHIQLSENLSEVLASGLEILQGIYNNQLQILSNRMTNVMTWLTILGTAVLVPNTIATAMGSTAFSLEPSDKWWYLALLALSTVAATVAVYYIIRRKMKMPLDVD
jgi:magnesium transporter